MVQLNPEMGRSHFISIRGAILVILNMKLDRAPFIANVLQNNPVILSRSGMKSWQRLKKKVVEHSIFSFNTGASRKSSNRFPIFIVINSVMVFCASGPRNQVSPIVKDLGVTRGFRGMWSPACICTLNDSVCLLYDRLYLLNSLAWRFRWAF